MKPRFAEDLTTEEIQTRIRRLLETKVFNEMELLLRELKYRRMKFRKRILEEMSEPLRTINKEISKSKRA